ncbi:hypothetical protein KIN20_030653 [Parelaphostrongylus tenuis]|uniref:Uncharacterized protein n=1 Tax=Parelaphostrongylus tenuis TaxID=148309 RepID=A0AAD5R453_PARTN|nr:hypothetical protein KIN20_030653 [Parelaphostrongylus tenuis]
MEGGASKIHSLLTVGDQQLARRCIIVGGNTITNIIMASWSKRMWQSALNRVIRILASGPLGSHFFSASATVGGN